MAELPLVAPADTEAPITPAPEEVAPEAAAAPPDELLKIPAFQALFAGSPPAVSFSLTGQSDRPERKLAEKNSDYLKEAGFRIFKAQADNRAVLYNALRIHPEDLRAAEKMGKLEIIAPDFDAVNHAVGKSGDANPILHAGEVPAAPASALSASTAPQAGSIPALAARVMAAAPQSGGAPPNVAPAPAGVQRKLAGARIASLKPSAPTAGPAPGQGSLLNSILKPVV